MYKLMLIGAILGACLTLTLAAGIGDAANGVLDTASKAVEEVKTVADKGTEQVSNLADNAKKQIEQTTDSAPHIPRQSNLPGSAARGAGRLIRDVVSEAGQFMKAVGQASYRLVTKVPSAIVRTVRESAARVAHPRHLFGDGATDNSGKTKSSGSPAKGADAPAELKRID